ncbi:MAG: CotH kinase family protein [Prolixibacteraceae bacterium]|nr:CotH kinase family protein [Prolixibacteraceae bacterium]
MLKRISIIMLFIWAGINCSNAQISFGFNSYYFFLKGKDASGLPSNWMNKSYNPSSWGVGGTPFRYKIGGGGTELNDMQNNYTTLYLKNNFNVQNVGLLDDVTFTINYDDGFIIWINGKEAIRSNAPGLVSNNGVAPTTHEFTETESVRIPASDLNLLEGENHLAIMVFNVSLTSSDLFFDIKIAAEKKQPEVSDSVKVIFSHKGGFYNSPFSMKMTVPDQQYTIKYTIDGSNPQTSATTYDGGKSKTITIDPSLSNGRAKTPCFIVRASLYKEGLKASKPTTQTYIFLDKVITQSHPGGSWPKDKVNGQTVDLDMDPDVTQNGQYKNQMVNSLKDIPSISLVTEFEDMFGASSGIYVNSMNHGEEWERFCSVELINPDGSNGFNVNAGVRTRGGWSRHNNYPKHGFRLFFREEYGAAKLKYPLFENEGVDEFDKIDLRCEQNYAWSNGDPRNTCVREVFSRDTQRDMGRPYTRSRYYHLYLNGMYWGLFQTQERAEARFAESYFGGDKDDYDVVKKDGLNSGVIATDGNLDAWERLWKATQKGFETNAKYFALEGKDEFGYPVKGKEIMVDIDNLIDYMLIIFYTGNFDSPVSSFSTNNSGVNNMFAIDKRDDKTIGFRYFIHDAEHSMMIDNANPGIGLDEDRVNLKMATPSSNYTFNPQWLHYKLTSNEEYRMRVADRVYKHFFNNGVFVPEIAQKRFAERVEQIDLAIIAESARWGDQNSGRPYTRNDYWLPEIERIYDEFFPYRTDIVLDQLIEGNLFPLVWPAIFKNGSSILTEDKYNSSEVSSVSLSTGSNGAVIYYTLDGSDPRMIGGNLNSSARRIENGGSIQVDGTTVVKSRVLLGNTWSALSEVAFSNDNEDYSKFKVTEINYHPSDSIIGSDTIDDKSFEFIEFKNTGDKPIDLSGMKFSSSVEYQFEDNFFLAPRQFYVVASKPKWFYERYGMVPSGNYKNNFNNAGEKIVVTSPKGAEIMNFQFYDVEPWPVAADGEGYSITTPLRYPSGNPNNFDYWVSSALINGSPFSDDHSIVDVKEEINVSNTGISLFPNPSAGKLNLKYNCNSKEINVEIYTQTGEMIRSIICRDNSVIDLYSINAKPGLLLFRIMTEGKTETKKILFRP